MIQIDHPQLLEALLQSYQKKSHHKNTTNECFHYLEKYVVVKCDPYSPVVVYHGPAVKPKSPQVWNVTFHQRSNRAVIHIRNPYQGDYLTPNNQLFQLDISSAEHSLVKSFDF